MRLSLLGTSGGGLFHLISWVIPASVERFDKFAQSLLENTQKLKVN